MYIQSLHVRNLRCFEHERVAFCYPGCPEAPALPNVTLLLGNNGAGKTTVLKAVALGVLGPVLESSGFVPYRLVRRKGSSLAREARVRARVRLHPQDTGARGEADDRITGASTRIVPRGDIEAVRAQELLASYWEGIFTEHSPAFLVVGYGASRRVETAASFDSSLRARARQLRYNRVAGLFEEQVTLTPLGAWLPEYRLQNPGRYAQVIRLINTLLPEGTRLLEQTEHGDHEFEHEGTRVPFPALSDGFRAYIGWVADLLYHVCMRAPSGQKLVDGRGIVLVDEIDLHLHPEWQRVVVPQLARALPNLQFILTSHSPIVAGTLHAANIRTVQAGPDGTSRISRLNERIHGLNADQILLSSYFGLRSTRAADAVNELRRLSREAQSGDEDAVLRFLRQLSADTFTDEEKAEMRTPSTRGTPRRPGLT